MMVRLAEPGRDPAERLARLNGELSRVLNRDPVRLVSSSTVDTPDGIVLAGIIGGKDVGKSALINALCGRVVSEDPEEVGEGTFGAVAYVHESDERALRERLRSVWVSDGERSRAVQDIVVHDSDVGRGLVLVDLPDMSSTFEAHASVVRSVAPVLDRIVWVWDPVLAGDRSYAERVGRVVKDPANLFFVLNKADLLLRDEQAGAPAARWDGWMSWFGSMVGEIGAGAPSDRWFAVSAAYPDAPSFVEAIGLSWGDPSLVDGATGADVGWFGERVGSELVRLRDGLLSPLTTEEVAQIKSRNASAEVASDRDAVVEHYDLERVLALMDEAPGAAADQVASVFDAEVVSSVARRLAKRGASESELAERVLSKRLDDWPILPALFWAARGVVRWVGRRMVSETSASDTLEAVWRVDGVPLEHRVDGLVSRVRARLSELFGALRVEPAMPDARVLADGARGTMSEIAGELDDALVRQVVDGRRRPGLLRRGMVWMLLLWFVALQPIVKGVLTLASGMDFSGGIIEGVKVGIGTGIDTALVVVAALGAGALLRGIAVVLLIYVLWLAAMYATAMRDVRRARGGADDGDADVYGQRVASLIERQIGGPILAPVTELGDRARRWREVLGSVESA